MFSVDFDLNEPSLTLHRDKNYFTISFCSHNPKYNAFQTVFGNYELYNIWNNIDLIYKRRKSTLKEFIHVNSIDSPHIFKFKILSNLKHKKIGDNIVFLKNNNSVFSLSSPYLYKLSSGNQKKDSISSKFNESLGIYEVKLQKYNKECYPIIIDPTIEIL